MQNIWRQQLQDISLLKDIILTSDQITKLVNFMAMLEFWNKKHNLTRIMPDDYVTKHIIDSLSLIDIVANNKFLDVGSGAGFPGIPLSIVADSTSAVLLDVSPKRCGFLRQVISELGLNNVQVIESSIEKYFPEQLFQVVVTRAFASLEKTVILTKHVVAIDGNIWCMKAKITQEELSKVNCEYDLVSHKSYDNKAKRCLVKLRPSVAK